MRIESHTKKQNHPKSNPVVHEDKDSSDNPPIKVATFNVLKPAEFWNVVQGYFAAAEPRYKYQLETLFPQLDEDIYSLQEVTPSFIDMLEESDFYKSGGYSHTPADLTNNYGHFPMIVSRIPFEILYNKDHILMCLFKKNNKNFIVVDAHLDPVEGNREVRKKQIETINSILNTLSDDPLTKHKERVSDAISNDNILFMGDLNIYFPGENEVLNDNEFYDLWLEKHSHNEGLTWDPEKNSMNHHNSIFDDRRLRLDRICMKKSKQFDLKDIKMIATDIIPEAELFPSDHFGLSAEFIPDSHGFIPLKTDFKDEFSALPQNETGFSTDRDILFFKVFSLITLWIFFVGFGFTMLKIFRKVFVSSAKPRRLHFQEMKKEYLKGKKLI